MKRVEGPDPIAADVLHLSEILAHEVILWLAENEYIDPENRPADWNKWTEALAVLLAEVVEDPVADR